MDFKTVLKYCEGDLIKTLRNKDESAVLLMERSGGKRFVLRIYNRQIDAYKALSEHSCPCLPEIEKFILREGFFVVEEEWIDGVSLQEMLDGGTRFTPSRAATLISHICSALSTLHQAGFIHRDVKPEHVIVTAEGRVVLIDLDASMEVQPEKNKDTMLLGTATYAAPEQFGLSRSDVRTDVYAIGILLNMVLTGTHPAVVKYKDGNLAQVIERCTRINPQDRYQSVAEVRDAIEKAMSDGAEMEHPSSQTGTVGQVTKTVVQGENAKPHETVMQGKNITPHETVMQGKNIKLGKNIKPGKRFFSKKRVAVIVAILCVILIAIGSRLWTTESGDGEGVPADKQGGGMIEVLKAEQDGWEQLYLDPNANYIIYYNYRQGSQSAPLYTEDGTLIDRSFTVYADPEVGKVTKWDTRRDNAWEFTSVNCQIGETGFLCAEKDGKKYRIQVLVMGEPISAYTSVPKIEDLADGYLKPEVNKYRFNEREIYYSYEPGEETTIYLAAMYGFQDLIPTCSDSHVTIEKCSDRQGWPFNLFKLTFSNPEGGNVIFEVEGDITSLTFVMTEA